MAAPKRRSARLATGDVTSPSYTPQLKSLAEVSETPQKNAKGVKSSESKYTTMPGAFEDENSLLRTPETAGRVYPGTAEMHPSKAQQSTTKAPDSGLRLGFTDMDSNGDAQTRVVELTPSKSSLPMSPRFNFKWNRPESDLGVEAQRIMESVRAEAARIKEKMRFESGEQMKRDDKANEKYAIGGRKIAKPKSRFSDAHKAEFSKMDSIADHVSLWKNKITSTPSNKLKRPTPVVMKSDQAEKVYVEDSPAAPPGKRLKKQMTDDVSTGISTLKLPSPIRSRVGVTHIPQTPKRQILKPKRLPTTVTTPTKSSLARSTSVKSIRSTGLQKSDRSKPAKDPQSPAPPKTEGNRKYFAALSRAPSMKSILSRAQPKFSNDPLKIAAGTHLPPIDLQNQLPDLPKILNEDSVLRQSPTLKRVGFKLDTTPKEGKGSNTTSPSKIPGRTSNTLDSRTKIDGDVVYPSLEKLVPGPLTSHPARPGDFTFRSNKPMEFGHRTGLKQPTIRHVHPGNIAFPCLPTVPHGVPNKKRRRVDEDEDEDELENLPPSSTNIQGSPAKKQKTWGVSAASTSVANTPKKRSAGLAKTPASKGKKIGLSLARLNMLAKPKYRR